MTIKISDLFGKVNSYSNSKVGRKGDASSSDEAEKYNTPGSDRTTISSKAVLLSEVSRINSEDERTRAERVQTLKAEVQSGKYLEKVSTKNVAEKVEKYLFDRA